MHTHVCVCVLVCNDRKELRQTPLPQHLFVCLPQRSHNALITSAKYELYRENRCNIHTNITIAMVDGFNDDGNDDDDLSQNFTNETPRSSVKCYCSQPKCDKTIRKYTIFFCLIPFCLP